MIKFFVVLALASVVSGCFQSPCMHDLEDEFKELRSSRWHGEAERPHRPEYIHRADRSHRPDSIYRISRRNYGHDGRVTYSQLDHEGSIQPPVAHVYPKEVPQLEPSFREQLEVAKQMLRENPEQKLEFRLSTVKAAMATIKDKDFVDLIRSKWQYFVTEPMDGLIFSKKYFEEYQDDQAIFEFLQLLEFNYLYAT